MAEMTKRQMIGWGMLGMVLAALLIVILILQIIMWNRAANGQAVFEYLNRQLASQSAPAAAAPAPTPAAPPPAKADDSKKGK